MASQVNDVIKRLSIAFKRNFEDYKGLYLFGVFLDGKEHEDEDIEIVALFDSEDKSKREQIWPIVGKIETARHYGRQIEQLLYRKKGKKNGQSNYSFRQRY